MREIELKILEINKTVVIKKLRSLKAKKLFEGLVRIKYFDFPDGRIRKKGDLLRVREFIQRLVPGMTEFVYKRDKGKKGGCKIFDETELTLEGEHVFDELSRVLKAVGLRQTVYYEKKRALFAYKQWKFEIDEHPRIPAFMEIEGKNPTAIKKAVKLLKLGSYETTSDTISQLLKRKYPKVQLNGLIF